MNRTEYRAHQLLMIQATDLGKPVINMFYGVYVGIIITAAYSLLRFHATLDPFLLLIFLLIGSVMAANLIVLLFKCVQVYSKSQDISSCFKALKPRQLGDNYRFWKSCRPLAFSLGPFGTVETNEFLLILLESVILQSVINLLLNF